MTVYELAQKARKVYPEYVIYRAAKYKNTVTFYFENPTGNSQMDRIVINGDISYTMDGEVTFVDLNNPAIWKDLVEIPTNEWQKTSLEHYGRKGMKWYQHIYGKEDSRGKYNTHGAGESVGMGMLLDRSARREMSGSLFGKPVADFAYRDLNPHFGEVAPDGTDYSHNCLNCGVVYDLNRRGYRVSAAPSGPGGPQRVTRCYKGGDQAMQYLDDMHLGDLGSPQANQQRNMEAMRQAIFDQPPGSRGVIICSGYGRNHCMAWERRDEDGFTVIDAQTGQNVVGDKWSFWKGAGCFGVMRTDNLEINDDTIDDVIDSREVPSPIPKLDLPDLGDLDDDLRHSDISYDALDDSGKQVFLEHYGRLGMKWYQHKFGEADGRAKYVDRYKKKETAKLEKRKAKVESWKEKAKYPSGNSPRAQHENQKYWQEKYKNGKAVVDAEMKKVKNADLDYIMKESKYVNTSAKAIVAANMVNIPMVLLGSPVMVVQAPNTARLRTDYRLNGEKYEKAMAERKKKKK